MPSAVTDTRDCQHSLIFILSRSRLRACVRGELQGTAPISPLFFFMKLHNSTFSIAALSSEERKMTVHGLQDLLVVDLTLSETD